MDAKMTARRWILVVCLAIILPVAWMLAATLIRDDREKAADARWADPYLRAEDEYAGRDARLEAYAEQMRKAEGRPPGAQER
ncbi:hypothetical protein [Paludisphaera mucosa]|uniref:Uncharacterized protein n=1 Tax=Paludisphaera mucosa TaxID=3030827 RepID=A0ABT6FKV1_9BACT|nr:hypothetical protein [Paludisphaera mucosa]MDG3008194.1 hypothetical protein [Paludisphaera mucosa]